MPAAPSHAPVDLERLRIDRGPAPGRPRAGRARAWIVRGLLAALVLAALWAARRPLRELADLWLLPEVAVVRVTPTSSLSASAVSGTAANGYVVARHRAALSADTPGRIVEMNVEEGSVVHAGDVVARLYAEEYEAALRRAEADVASAGTRLRVAEAELRAAGQRLQELSSREAAAEARLDEARASLRLARTSHERAERLLEERVVSRERVDETLAELERARARVAAAKASLHEARAAVRSGESEIAVREAAVAEAHAQIPVYEAARDLARATLEKTKVRAPFDGIVVLKDAEVGEVVSPNATGNRSRGSVATLVDFASLEVQVELPETSLSSVSVGAPAYIYLDAFPEKRYEGEVLRIWPTANRQKATVELRVGFAETDELLRPEMGARVVFSPEEPASAEEAPRGGEILVPAQALVRREGRSGVFVLEGAVARFREVRTDGERSGRVRIASGLDDGDRVVAAPTESLEDGDRVRVVEG